MCATPTGTGKGLPPFRYSNIEGKRYEEKSILYNIYDKIMDKKVNHIRLLKRQKCKKYRLPTCKKLSLLLKIK